MMRIVVLLGLAALCASQATFDRFVRYPAYLNIRLLSNDTILGTLPYQPSVDGIAPGSMSVLQWPGSGVIFCELR